MLPPETPTRKKYDHYISVRVDDDLYALIVKLAQEEERPIGMMTRILLKEAAKAREEAGPGKKGKYPPPSGKK